MFDLDEDAGGGYSEAPPSRQALMSPMSAAQPQQQRKPGQLRTLVLGGSVNGNSSSQAAGTSAAATATGDKP